jgi:hypothetical protein
VVLQTVEPIILDLLSHSIKVKEHNQSLIDDSLVMSDKIGAANFFWSFPSQAVHEQNLKKRNLEEMIAASTQNCLNEQNRIEELTVERSSSDRPEKVCSYLIKLLNPFSIQTLLHCSCKSYINCVKS